VYCRFSVGEVVNISRSAASLVEKLKNIDPAIMGRMENFATFFFLIIF